MENPFTPSKNRVIEYMLSQDFYPTAWHGHLHFAHWLVCKFKPNIIVDLGVDYGHSTFSWALSGIGKVYGIDLYIGGSSYEQTLSSITYMKNTFGIGSNISILKKDFNDAVKDFEDNSIDILHIDGDHQYDSVKNDFENWSKKLSSNGIIVMHDTISYPNDVGKYFNEISGYHKIMLTHSHGLGILSKDIQQINTIIDEWIKQLQYNNNNTITHKNFNITFW
jgi:hypothetical protein